MVDLRYGSTVVNGRRTDWGAIWAGVFTFIAIWSVFGLLGMAIFASAANPNAQNPVTGMSAGMGIWAVVLTFIAMYVGGLETGPEAVFVEFHAFRHGLQLIQKIQLRVAARSRKNQLATLIGVLLPLP